MMCGARVPTARLASMFRTRPSPKLSVSRAVLAQGQGVRKAELEKVCRLVALRYTVPVSQRTKVPLDQPVVHEQPGWSETIP
jgi:hypothetical protein